MLWAIAGKTAAELIENRSNSDVPNMGLTSWRGSIVRKQDVAIAKNYLNADEIKDLNEIVTMYLDYAERQARQRKTVTMKQWADKLDAFLEFNEQELLTHAGKVKAEVARKIAEDRYEEFDNKRKKAEALAADEEDLKQLEEIKKNCLRSGGSRMNEAGSLDSIVVFPSLLPFVLLASQVVLSFYRTNRTVNLTKISLVSN